MRTLVELIIRYSVWVYVACGLGIIFYLRLAILARRERTQALFTLERERAASRFWRSLLMMGVLLVVVGGILGASLSPLFQTIPVSEGTEVPSPVVTPLLQPTPEVEYSTPTPSLTPSPTSTSPTPTMTPSPTPTRIRRTPTPTPTPPGPACLADACITYPKPGMQLRGRIDIHGTANIPDFQFYKVEFASAEQPERWNSVTEEHKTPVTEGVLEVWDTSALPEGEYILRLTVVDKTGNYPTPCQVQVSIKPPEVTPSPTP